MASYGLPTIPLVPISSSQVIVGAIVGIGLLKGGQELDWRILFRIMRSWFTTPPVAMLMCLLLLTLAQNVFKLDVYNTVHYRISDDVIQQVQGQSVLTHHEILSLQNLRGKTVASSEKFKIILRQKAHLKSSAIIKSLTGLARVSDITIRMHKLEPKWVLSLSPERLQALQAVDGLRFEYRWQMEEALGRESVQWLPKPDNVLNKKENLLLYDQLNYLVNYLSE